MKIKMIVLIQIHYIAVGIGSLQRGEFKLKGRKSEQVAYAWWKQIRRESSVDLELEKIICDGEDITELVKKIDEAPLD